MGPHLNKLKGGAIYKIINNNLPVKRDSSAANRQAFASNRQAFASERRLSLPSGGPIQLAKALSIRLQSIL